MSAEWYYAKNKQKVGPVTFEQLKELVRSGELARTNMVLRQGTPKWIEASQVDGLFESNPLQAVPPPLPPPVPVAEWYFLKSGQQHGPVTADQLRASIAPSGLVWRAGLAQWVAGSTIPGLFPGVSQPASPAPPPVPVASKAKPVDRAFKAAPSTSTEEILEVLPADKGAPVASVATNRVTGELNLVGRNGWGTSVLHIILDGEEIGTKSWIDGIHHLQFESTVGHHTVTLRNGDSEDNAKSYPVEFRKPGHYTLTFTTGWFLQEFPTGIEKSYSPQALAPLPVSSVRRKALCGSWQPIAESHQGMEFTEDGAVVFSDGAAGRFTASGKAPNEVIEMEMVNGQTTQFKIISLTQTQLVIAEGNEARTFRRAGSSPSTPRRATEEAMESGISDPTVAKQVAQKKAAAQWHAKPVETRTLSEPEHTIFSGDAPCPKCTTLIWVEWKNTTVSMACPKCGFRFDHDKAIAFLSASKPEDNYKADLAPVAVEAVDVLERAKALLASHEAATSDETALLEEIAQLERQMEGSEKEARTTGDWSRDTELSANLLALKQKLKEIQKAGRKAASRKKSKQQRNEDRSSSSEPDPIDTICPHCLAHYRARIHVGDTTRCDRCLEDFVVYTFIGEPSRGFFEGLNPLALIFEKCPQCRSAAVRLGRITKPPEWWSADTVWHGFADYYLCNQCRITWVRSGGLRT